MFRGDDLRKVFGLSAVRLMATDAENGGIELWRQDRTRILGMFCQRTVAGFAVHACMFSLVLHANNIRVAGLAGLVSGKPDWLGGNFHDGISAIVAIFAKALRYQGCPQEDKGDDRDREDHGDTQQMLDILERVHRDTRP